MNSAVDKKWLYFNSEISMEFHLEGSVDRETNFFRNLTLNNIVS